MIKKEINEDTKTLTIEWNNRDFVRMDFLSIFLIVAWLFSIVLAGGSIWVLATGRNVGPDILMYFAIGMGGLFALFLPFFWLKRYATERIEITPKSYRHYHVEYPWLLPCNWPTKKITKFDFGFHENKARGDTETMVTLNAWRGWRRDIIGYWLDEEDLRMLFGVISKYVELLDQEIALEEHFEEEYGE
ncbi:MAG: hypothetical protein CMJ78_05535 [Planctomycetaceae bacterium]|nr:hypothetical protein [Planctomycetaceae bacterium]